MIFKKNKKTTEVNKQSFSIEWEQTNKNGVLSDRIWSITFDKGYTRQFFFGITKENLIELRDLLNKQCLD